MKRAWMTSGLLAATVLASAGCVPEQKYNDLLTAYKGQEQQLLTAQNELATARANEERLRTQIAATMADLEELQKRMASGNGDLDAWIAKYDELKKQLASLEINQLPPDLSKELEALALSNPDVFEFDPRTGMLRFKNDFTFDPGSDQLKPGASAVLASLAAILNSPSASEFEVKVVGHTDNTPVVRTKAKFGSNMMLSVFRSASLGLPPCSFHGCARDARRNSRPGRRLAAVEGGRHQAEEAERAGAGVAELVHGVGRDVEHVARANAVDALAAGDVGLSLQHHDLVLVRVAVVRRVAARFHHEVAHGEVRRAVRAAHEDLHPRPAHAVHRDGRRARGIGAHHEELAGGGLGHSNPRPLPLPRSGRMRMLRNWIHAPSLWSATRPATRSTSVATFCSSPFT